MAARQLRLLALRLRRKNCRTKRIGELETIEQRVADAEKEMQLKHDALLDPAIMSDGARLHAASLELEAAQKMIDDLYARWVELETKLK